MWKAGLSQIFCIGREGNVSICKTLSRNFFGWILPIPHHFNSSFVDVKANDLEMFGKCQCNGESHISESHHRHGGILAQQLFVEIHEDEMAVMR